MIKLLKAIDNYFFEPGEEEIKPYFYSVFVVGTIALIITGGV